MRFNGTLWYQTYIYKKNKILQHIKTVLPQQCNQSFDFNLIRI